jgi:serine/threonine-protein kinase RsbW
VPRRKCKLPAVKGQLVLRNDPSELRRMAQWIIKFCNKAELSEKPAFALQLCLEEAVTNSMRHGEANAPATRIVANIVRDGNDIVMMIEDNGSPFDPTKFAVRPCAHSLDEASLGGLGLILMRHFAHRIEYERIGGLNRLSVKVSRE